MGNLAFLEGNQMCLLSLTTSTVDGCPSNKARRLPGRANLPQTGEDFDSESKGIFLTLLCCAFGPNMSGIFPHNWKWIAISIFNLDLFMSYWGHMATDEVVFPILPLILSALFTGSTSSCTWPLPSSLLRLLGLPVSCFLTLLLPIFNFRAY